IVGDVLGGHSLQQLAHMQRALANHVGDDLGCGRHLEAIDLSLAKARTIERRLAQRFGRRPAGGGDRSACPILLDDTRAVAEEGSELARSVPGGPRPDDHEVIAVTHCISSSIFENALFNRRAFLISSAVAYGYSPYYKKLGH